MKKLKLYTRFAITIIISLGLFACIPVYGLNAVGKPITKSTFTGQIPRNGRKGRDTLTVRFNPDTAYNVAISETLMVITDTAGNFSFTLPMTCLYRVVIIDRNISTFFGSLNPFIAEPGDQVNISADIRKGHGFVAKVDFSGKGSAKYNCMQALDEIKLSGITALNSREQITQACDSLLNAKIKELNVYKGVISPAIYKIIRADFIGDLGRSLFDLSYYNKTRKTPINNPVFARKDFNNLYPKFIAEYPVSLTETLQSSQYIDFIYYYQLLIFAFDSNCDLPNINMQTFFDRMSHFRPRKIRDRLLWLILSSNRAFQGVSTKEYLTYLNKSLEIIATANVRKEVYSLYKTAHRMDAYDFHLRKDSSNKVVSLSQLRGKVVLIDFSNEYYCTPCRLFADAFHKLVYPKFKNDPRFQMVDIVPMANDERTTSFMHYLKNEDINGSKNRFFLTDSTNITLFAGTKDAQTISTYYKQTAAPLLVLIDKNGKVISTTLTNFPFIESASSPNVPRLIAMIQNALKEN